MARSRLSIPDMSCGHCEANIKKALQGLEGVDGVSVDLPGRKVDVSYDESRLSLDRIREILAEEDYPVETAQAL